MTNKRVSPVSLQALQADGRLPSGPQLEVHEVMVRRDLPVLESVDAAKTESERMRAYDQLIAKQYAEFVQEHGDPYGVEVHAPRLAPAKVKRIAVPLTSIMYGAA
ncbi:hypothetical protein [Comamonas testosteroni]|jgi:hypothetical protein|uniref:hypothetical protein n=1 Tax=Comamonas testosteroni TaxID=285 RepID=UPI0026EEE5DC|nr:hypothetical protein [Comamonas testosteroni]